ncbi:hypothetical protein C5F47_00720 [Nitrosopumilus cobalaminigenes]|uniref:Polysaccharide biosynthesis protein C-terminal domain-containing protein n=1 Tax=Nitrosopumilus cobalaminigenes TaxID=1470066 RepID=A0A7D5LYQ1_9ARCH|nr:hypothetical protein [Nitrosopumilus cobalaminigenes]QLH02206.1 hypothetical protein C5F47_00720 [Nitrosopumilus cobalaminigenes]
MSNIRVTYSGLISLVLGIVSVLLGLIFMLIVTRTLNPLEYGTWGLISGIVLYASIIEPMISYWAIRETARNVDSGKTAVSSSLLISLGGIAIYLVSAYLVSGKTDANQDVILMGTILIPLIFLNRVLTSISFGWKPQSASFGQLCFALIEIPVVLLLVYFLQLGTVGVIFTVAIAYSASIIFYLIYSREKLRNNIKKEFLKKWFKLSWIALYPAIGLTALFLDVTIFSIITGSVIGIAFWTASLVITNIITNSGLISRAVYPKLLQGNGHEFLSDNLRHLFYFSILFTFLSITFAKPALFALNPTYVVAVPIVIILSIQIFLYTISGNLQTFITGIEKVDENINSTFKDYLKSKLFHIPTITIIQSILYLASLTIVLFVMNSTTDSQLDLVIYWAIVSLSIQVPISIITFILIKKHFTVKFDLKSIFKYLFGGLISLIITNFLLELFLVYNVELIEFLPNVIIYLFIGISIYFGITYLIDNKTRKLFESIFRAVLNKNY